MKRSVGFCTISELPNPSIDVVLYPTNPFTILEPRDQEMDEFYLVEGRRATDFEAPKLGKNSSGSSAKLIGRF